MKPQKTPDPTSQNFEPFSGSERSLEEYFANYPSARKERPAHLKTIVVIGQHRYYKLFSAQLLQCDTGTNGQLKNPLVVVNPIDFMWKSQRPEELKFYAAIAKFQSFYERSQADLEALKALIANPLLFDFYLHKSDVSEKINARSVSPVSISHPQMDFQVNIELNENLFSISGSLTINGFPCPLTEVQPGLDHFLVRQHHWYLCENPEMFSSITYFLRHNNHISLEPNDFNRFKSEVLAEMENHITVNHRYLKQGGKTQLAQAGLDAIPQKLIYLSENGNYICLTPVMRYGDNEIPLRSKRPILAEDFRGEPFSMKRDLYAEDRFQGLITRQHPHFSDQLDGPLPYFYLHKSRFLDENWFLDTFEDWRAHDIHILGFKELKGNKLNPHKSRVNIEVTSGLNWFNADVDVRYGRTRASLKQLKKAVVNKSKYVQLDDGTIGMIPEEWLKKFATYFRSADIVDDMLHIPKVNFSAISQLYDEQMLDEQVKEELLNYQSKLLSIKSIANIPAPEELQATLRPYQLYGLSWLNFLDDLNFGGCLADDMGLGKTIQVIAFILQLRKKHGVQTHLLVLPTSLIHNWNDELQKFAPSVKLLIHHGPDRAKTTEGFDGHEVIITTYNILTSDIGFLRKYNFSCVFLDESQNIKNTTSQRYKAARLLNSRNRIVITGTPLENNTFDLYAQLSFACPGLLGNKTYFRHTYAVPIDKFKDRRSAGALHEKVSPFILRRTKKEVATELPEKTEITLHCEMGPEQRKVYDAYEREFREYISAHDEEEIDKNPMHVLRGITRLRQICNSPALIGENNTGGEPPAKIRMLMEQVRSISDNHKILIFSQFVSMLELIGQEMHRENVPFVKLTGNTKNRGEVVSQFQNDEKIRVFLISLKAGGTGLNLTAADYVFLVDPWWNPAVENQAIDRVYRIGQEKHVIAARLICPDTVEEKIRIMQEGKSELADKLIATGNSVKSFKRRDWLKLAT